ncbi:MAG: biotin--[acetyl-CoA-carboxylase] ligase [Acidobacteriaceae bacterium]|jgi:BirA family biotin operon repressor/biotin-[acetyl-CoA-carboxylase] ligase
MSSREELNPVALRSALVGTRFPARLHHFPTAESTNTLLLEAAANGAPEGTVYLADAQTQGRGRGGHTWHSSPGDGLYLSVLAMPRLPLREALWISLATGLAVQSAIKTVTGLSADIRWPNDLLLPQPSGPGKKLGGILVEAAVQPGDDAILRYAVIGIGLNINHESFPPDLAPIATSLRIATGEPQSRNALMIAILRALDLELTQLEAHQPDLPAQQPDILTRFTAASSWVRGKRVQVPEQGGYTGTTAGLDRNGYLLVDADDHTQRTVLSGGVRDQS